MIHKRAIYLPMVGITTLIIGIWAIKIYKDQLPLVDEWTRGFVASLQDTAIFDFFRVITELGSGSFLVPFTIIAALFLFYIFKDWFPALLFSGGTLGVHLFNKFIKGLVERERPRIWEEANAEGFSFPSGHAMIPIVCYGIFAYYISKKIKSTKLKLLVKVLFALLIFLIGFSRYVINVHYLTDIITGFFIGFGCLILLISIDKWVMKRRTQS
ncbi:MAG TPA: phosphatase PAP2 family protein [Candidatus Avamphibacillus sp.]|nr:phosphatase PAP2 family protein [Candidatus Avamphibacillus sp.]